MAGIFGVLRLDGTSADGSILDELGDALDHRAPEGVRTLTRGPVGLGSCPSVRVPRDRRERLPRTWEPDGAVTADARVDNRRRLAELLDRPDVLAEPAGTVLEAAWRNWGPDLVDPVVGPLAAAFWDGASNRLTCVRDYIGHRPFYYVQRDGSWFAFATEKTPLLRLDGVGRDVDRQRVLDHYALHFGDTERTFHREVRRLPPGHLLTISPESGSPNLDRYWSPWTVPVDRDMSPGEAASGLRRALRRSVQTRCRSPGRVASTLSGGLDSSSVTVLAREGLPAEERLRTYAWASGNLSACDESGFVRDVLGERDGLDHAWIPGNEGGPIDGYDRAVRALDEPVLWPNLFLLERTWETAADEGIPVVLDGLFGDRAIYGGEAHITRLARRGRWIRLVRTLRSVASTSGRSPWDLLRRRVVLGNLPTPLRSHARELQARTSGCTDGPGPLVGLTPPYRDGAFSRFRRGPAYALHGSGEREHRAYLASGHVAYQLEVLDVIAARIGVRPRHPMLDRRVVEHSLRTPSRHRISNGYTRSTLRAAMEGLLVDSVRKRPDKGPWGLNVHHGMLVRQGSRTLDLLEDPGPLVEGVVREELLASVRRRVEDGTIDDLQSSEGWALGVAVPLSLWTRVTGQEVAPLDGHDGVGD